MTAEISGYSSSLRAYAWLWDYPGLNSPTGEQATTRTSGSAAGTIAVSSQNGSGVKVDISPEAREMAQSGQKQSGEVGADGEALSEDEKKQVKEMKATDREVRAHEQAHLAAAGGLAKGGAHFSYETGPDGKRYAVNGEVDIDTSAVPDDPEATLRKAQQIRRAALAPADPSAQDRKVAAQASKMAAEAQQQLQQENGMGEDAGSNEKNAQAAETPRLNITI